MKEDQRIREAYGKRDHLEKYKLYTVFDSASIFISQQRERAIIELLRGNRVSDLSERRILDLGCGKGGVLGKFISYGARPENCYGIDLLPDRIEEARKLFPNIDFHCGNAEDLPYENEFFNMVLCFTVFTSIFDRSMKRNIAREMMRVLKKEGIILWYDYHINNPKNTDVRGVKKKEIHRLFSNCDIQLRRITLAPPLARVLAPHSWLCCYLLEKLKVFSTHYIGIIRKETGVAQTD